MDYGKYCKYQKEQARKEAPQEAGQHKRAGDKLRPKIGGHDFNASGAI